MASKFNKLADEKVGAMGKEVVKLVYGNSDEHKETEKETKKPEKNKSSKTKKEKFRKGEYRTEMISFRVSKRLYDKLINEVKESKECKSIADYMNDLLNKNI